MVKILTKLSDLPKYPLKPWLYGREKAEKTYPDKVIYLYHRSETRGDLIFIDLQAVSPAE